MFRVERQAGRIVRDGAFPVARAKGRIPGGLGSVPLDLPVVVDGGGGGVGAVGCSSSSSSSSRHGGGGPFPACLCSKAVSSVAMCECYCVLIETRQCHVEAGIHTGLPVPVTNTMLAMTARRNT